MKPPSNDSDHSDHEKHENAIGRRTFFREFWGLESETDSSIETSDPLEKDSSHEKDENLEEKPINRRDFFGETLRALIAPAAEYLEYRLSPLVPEEKVPPRFLRPPGSDFEHLFISSCEKSGQCIEVCPVQAIKVMHSEDSVLDGTPVIQASTTACVVCNGLECMKACPSGALQLIPKEEINMGMACMDYDSCLRTKGEDCRICVEKCPVGEEALVIHEGKILVMISGCIGCGICEQYCPTSPKAIVVDPK